MVLPNFIIIGAAKSGTTSLARYLSMHPSVFMPNIKEPHFFIKEKPLGEWVRTLEEYEELFDKGKTFPLRGEASTGYLYFYDESAESINNIIPNCKIVIILRNPLDRAYSMYWHCVRDGREKLSFEDALAIEKQRIQNRWEYSYHYTNRGYVSKGIKKYNETFGHNNVHILFFEDLKKEPDKLLRSLFKFLDLKPIKIDTKERYNYSGKPRFQKINNFLHKKHPLKNLGYFLPKRTRDRLWLFFRDFALEPKPSMNPETRNKLLVQFEQEIKEVERLTGRDLSNWRD